MNSETYWQRIWIIFQSGKISPTQVSLLPFWNSKRGITQIKLNISFGFIQSQLYLIGATQSYTWLTILGEGNNFFTASTKTLAV